MALLLAVVLPLPTPSAHGQHSNMLWNPDFEEGGVLPGAAPAYWSVLSSSGEVRSSRLAGAAHSHLWSLVVAPEGDEVVVQSAPAETIPERTMRASVWARGEGTVTLVVHGQGLREDVATVLTPEWSQVVLDFIVPAGLTEARVSILVPGHASLVQLDDASLAVPE